MIEIASEKDIEYPFARQHTTYLFDDDIVLRLQDGSLIQITGKYQGNHCIREVVETYADDLAYNEVTGLAEQYFPMGKQNGVIIDPTVRFGDPIVRPSMYTVETLVTAVRTEGNVERAAAAYEVTKSEIKIAQRYEDWLLGKAG